MSRGESFEDTAGSLIALVLLLSLVALVMLVHFVAGLLEELGRVYLESGPLPRRVKMVLWGALIGFVLLTLCCLAVGTLIPAAAALAIYLSCWAFLVFVVIVETAEWWGRKELGPPTLDTYLSPPADAAPAIERYEAEAIA